MNSDLNAVFFKRTGRPAGRRRSSFSFQNRFDDPKIRLTLLAEIGKRARF